MDKAPILYRSIFSINQRNADHIHYEVEGKKLVEQARKEVAMEIFKELEMLMYNISPRMIMPKVLDNIKSKYLGEPK